MLTFDIETVPLLASLEVPYPERDRNPPGNMSKPDTIAAWRVKDEAEWHANRAKECALNARLGRVVAIGYATRRDMAEGRAGGHVDPDTGDLSWADVSAREEDEADVLRAFWRNVESFHRVAGFNSFQFDLPFLIIRSMILGELPVANLGDYLKRYSYRPHFDARLALSMWEMRAEGTLNDWCAAFDLPGKTGSGADVWPMVQAGKFDEVREYARNDARVTHGLVSRVAPFLIGGE